MGVDKRVRIPVNVRARSGQPEIEEPAAAPISDAGSAVTGFEGMSFQAASTDEPAPRADRSGTAAAEPVDGGQEWRDRALRLQAEMENFRKRQQRAAQDEIQAERQRLLLAFLTVVDDLERALAAPARDGDGLREGVVLTHRAALQWLKREGVERIPDRGRPFDPNWHEAVTTVDHRRVGVESNEIVDVLAPGYRYRDTLLRPARVVVAV